MTLQGKLTSAATALGLCVALGGTAQAQPADPNLAAVKAVCGRCHGETQFTGKPRSWQRWNDVFLEMSKLGATGSDEQLEQVTAYFLDHLTTLNVNSSPADELAWVLNVNDAVAQDIVARRQRKPFASLSELAAVPGLSRERLERLKPRIQF
jgi:DNA uptake protein ComE-like DNA-binding protein